MRFALHSVLGKSSDGVNAVGVVRRASTKWRNAGCNERSGVSHRVRAGLPSPLSPGGTGRFSFRRRGGFCRLDAPCPPEDRMQRLDQHRSASCRVFVLLLSIASALTAPPAAAALDQPLATAANPMTI